MITKYARAAYTFTHYTHNESDDFYIYIKFQNWLEALTVS